MAAPTNYSLPLGPISHISFRPPLSMCRCTLGSKSPSTVGEQVFSVTSSNKYEFDYLGQSTKGDLNLNYDHLDSIGSLLLLLLLVNYSLSYY